MPRKIDYTMELTYPWGIAVQEAIPDQKIYFPLLSKYMRVEYQELAEAIRDITRPKKACGIRIPAQFSPDDLVAQISHVGGNGIIVYARRSAVKNEVKRPEY